MTKKLPMYARMAMEPNPRIETALDPSIVMPVIDRGGMQVEQLIDHRPTKLETHYLARGMEVGTCMDCDHVCRTGVCSALRDTPSVEPEGRCDLWTGISSPIPITVAGEPNKLHAHEQLEDETRWLSDGDPSAEHDDHEREEEERLARIEAKINLMNAPTSGGPKLYITIDTVNVNMRKASNGSSTPGRPYQESLPDYQSLYFGETVQGNQERERAASEDRRRRDAKRASGIFGTAGLNPGVDADDMMKYEADEHAMFVRDPRGLRVKDPTVKAPRVFTGLPDKAETPVGETKKQRRKKLENKYRRMLGEGEIDDDV
jgi:hypothetical protein